MTVPDQRFRVLIADDVREVRDMLRFTLSFFYDVIVARNGEEAWELINSERPDAVMTDLVMPRIKGSDLVRMIRTQSPRPDIPVIVVTGATRDRELADNLWRDAIGSDGFVSKPFSPMEVRSLLGRLLANRVPLTFCPHLDAGT
jgi:two-component system response regulator VicR